MMARERFICTTASGQPVVKTNDPAAAQRYQHVLRGRVIDLEHLAPRPRVMAPA